MENDLQNLRKEIDTANKELVELLSKRARIAQQIGAAKKSSEIYRPEREAQVLVNVLAQNGGPLSDAALAGIFKEIIGACRNLERRLRVAYLGPEGTYSEEAAIQFAGRSSDFVPCAAIEDAVQLVQRGEADIAVIPVENSTEGAINRTLDILLETDLNINGEILLPIHHQLLSKQTKLQDVQEVLAHPQALAQCRQWLAVHLPHAKQIPAASNAEAVRLAAGHDSKAAIAGARAADMYKLPVLRANIEDSAANTTRFLVLGQQDVPLTSKDKTSLVCSVPNRTGSLHELLGIFARHGINLTKLESRPASSAKWDYVFFIDFDGHQTEKNVAAALDAVRKQATMVKVLGSYPKAVV